MFTSSGCLLLCTCTVGSGGLYQGWAQEPSYRVPLCSGGGEADPVSAPGHWTVPWGCGPELCHCGEHHGWGMWDAVKGGGGGGLANTDCFNSVDSTTRATDGILWSTGCCVSTCMMPNDPLTQTRCWHTVPHNCSYKPSYTIRDPCWQMMPNKPMFRARVYAGAHGLSYNIQLLSS